MSVDAPSEVPSADGIVEFSPNRRFGRFDKRLGGGSSKRVFEAIHLYEGRMVAWCVVNLAVLPEHERDVVRREAQLLSDLDHPRILKCYEAWEASDAEIVLITAIAQGGTLQELYERGPGFKLKAVRRWARQVCEGLAYLHARGLVHRDIKCANLFRNKTDGSVTIGDFGLTAPPEAPGGGAAPAPLGTPNFMAPEVWHDEYDDLADVYALGMTVLELVTGRVPYSECGTLPALFRKLTEGEPPSALSRVRHASVVEFVKLCIQPVSSRPSAAELLQGTFLDVEGSPLTEDDEVDLAVDVAEGATDEILDDLGAETATDEAQTSPGKDKETDKVADSSGKKTNARETRAGSLGTGSKARTDEGGTEASNDVDVVGEEDGGAEDEELELDFGWERPASPSSETEGAGVEGGANTGAVVPAASVSASVTGSQDGSERRGHGGDDTTEGWRALSVGAGHAGDLSVAVRGDASVASAGAYLSTTPLPSSRARDLSSSESDSEDERDRIDPGGMSGPVSGSSLSPNRPARRRTHLERRSRTGTSPSSYSASVPTSSATIAVWITNAPAPVPAQSELAKADEPDRTHRPRSSSLSTSGPPHRTVVSTTDDDVTGVLRRALREAGLPDASLDSLASLTSILANCPPHTTISIAGPASGAHAHIAVLPDPNTTTTTTPQPDAAPPRPPPLASRNASEWSIASVPDASDAESVTTLEAASPGVRFPKRVVRVGANLTPAPPTTADIPTNNDITTMATASPLPAQPPVPPNAARSVMAHSTATGSADSSSTLPSAEPSDMLDLSSSPERGPVSAPTKSHHPPLVPTPSSHRLAVSPDVEPLNPFEDDEGRRRSSTSGEPPERPSFLREDSTNLASRPIIDPVVANTPRGPRSAPPTIFSPGTTSFLLDNVDNFEKTANKN